MLLFIFNDSLLEEELKGDIKILGSSKAIYNTIYSIWCYVALTQVKTEKNEKVMAAWAASLPSFSGLSSCLVTCHWFAKKQKPTNQKKDHKAGKGDNASADSVKISIKGWFYYCMYLNANTGQDGGENISTITMKEIKTKTKKHKIMQTVMSCI